MENDCLVIYFSRANENYFGGKLIDLIVGNTEIVAERIASTLGCETFKIEPINPYPKDYHETTLIAKEELSQNARPAFKGSIRDFEIYDTIFLGYPNWWSTMPMAVWTLLESYDFAGKTIIPFCTHEGSRLGNSVADIKKLCPRAEITDELAIYGSETKNAQSVINDWEAVKKMTK